MDGMRFDHLAKTVAARGSRRRVLGALLAGALGGLRLGTAVADDSGTAIADASGGNHNLASAADQASSGQDHDRDRDRDNNDNNDNNHDHDHDHDHDGDGDNNSGGDAECKAAGESCGVIKGDGVDSSCCTGICVERGECSAKSGCGNNSCNLATGTLCCYGATCDSAGNCIPW